MCKSCWPWASWIKFCSVKILLEHFWLKFWSNKNYITFRLIKDIYRLLELCSKMIYLVFNILYLLGPLKLSLTNSNVFSNNKHLPFLCPSLCHEKQRSNFTSISVSCGLRSYFLFHWVSLNSFLPLLGFNSDSGWAGSNYSSESYSSLPSHIISHLFLLSVSRSLFPT